MSEETQQVVAAPEAPVDGERQRLMRDAVVNNLAAPVSAVVGIVLVPIMLRALGQDNYGLWIVASSMSGIIAAVDFGMSWSITRAVAADSGRGEGDIPDFARTVLNIYLLLGLLGCLIIGGAGMLTGGYLHLPPVERRTVILVFWIIGASLCADQVSAFGFSVLAGLRRFKSVAIIGSLASIAWAVGAIAILKSGGSVAAVAACQLAVAVLKGAGTLWLVARLATNYRLRPGLFFKLSALRRRASFAASSVLMSALSKAAWNSAPVVIGFVGGSAAAVPFYVGQKFPLAVLMIAWSAGEVLFPAASESQHDIVRVSKVLQAGSRLVMVMTLPGAALLFVAAPSLLHAWLGNPPPGSVTVMRILTVTVLLDALSASPMYLLIGRGIMRPILAAETVKGVGVVALSLALVYPLGVTGAAWGMLMPIGASSAALFVVAARLCELNPLKLAAGTLRGLWLPVSASVPGALSILYFKGDGRIWVVAALLVGGLLYLAVLFGYAGNDEEKWFARNIYRRVRNTTGETQ